MDDFRRKTWDAVIVGTGMGGGTLGLALARRGWQVLFLEKGVSNAPGAQDDVRGRLVDETFDRSHHVDGPARHAALARGGRSWDEIEDVTKGSKRFVPFIGSGVGGSSALYGMVCERLFDIDLTPRLAHPRATDAALPESWPITADELRPWYEQAERLYQVRGEPDPLRPGDNGGSLAPPPPLTPAGAELFEHFQREGLHPYHLHTACDGGERCASCQGFLCDRPCKRESGQTAVWPAIRDHGAALVSDCVAIRFDSDAKRVTKLLARHRGEEVSVQGRHYFLAAGALVSPLLLLGSRSRDWPQGLGNRFDLVGRHLMRHCIDLVMVKPKTPQSFGGRSKELSLNDFYLVEGEKLGTLQSFGSLPGIEFFLHQPGWLGRAARALAPALRWGWRKAIEPSVVLAAIMEDLPQADNRVLPSDSGGVDRQRLRLRYQLSAGDQERLGKFRELVKSALVGYRPFALRLAEDNSALGHVCGTCRFGNDVRSSVLDRFNRVHELDNLHVVDGSFFPTSGGINPSLTIAANALRVAAHLAGSESPVSP